MEFFDVISKRRSVRDLSSESLKEEEVNKIIEAGLLAPVAMGKYSKILFTVLEKKTLEETKKEFYSALGKDLFYDGSLVIIISQKDEVIDLYNQNAGCILENMMLEATDLNIGSVYLYSPIRVSRGNEKLTKALHVKEGYTPVACATFGYIKSNKINENLKRDVLIEKF